VVDPRDGRPVTATRLAAVVARHGAASEAWSTALLVLSERLLSCGLSPAALPTSAALPRSLAALVRWRDVDGIAREWRSPRWPEAARRERSEARPLLRSTPCASALDPPGAPIAIPREEAAWMTKSRAIDALS
jgi:hypothetical protein